MRVKRHRGIRLALAALGLNIVSAALVTSAHGDIVAVMVGNMMEEQRCQESDGPSERVWRSAQTQVAALMQTYVAVAAAHDQKALTKLFSHPESGGVMAGAAVMPVGAIDDPWVGAPSPPDTAVEPAKLQFGELSVANDGLSARGSWKAVRLVAGDPTRTQELIYIVDFNANQFWGGHWRLWRVRIYRAGEELPILRGYCHRVEIPPLWEGQ